MQSHVDAAILLQVLPCQIAEGWRCVAKLAFGIGDVEPYCSLWGQYCAESCSQLPLSASSGGGDLLDRRRYVIAVALP
jgi:hypothetical protein